MNPDLILKLCSYWSSRPSSIFREVRDLCLRRWIELSTAITASPLYPSLPIPNWTVHVLAILHWFSLACCKGVRREICTHNKHIESERRGATLHENVLLWRRSALVVLNYWVVNLLPALLAQGGFSLCFPPPGGLGHEVSLWWRCLLGKRGRNIVF